MANHGYVKTKKFMNAESVHEFLTNLNETVFKDVLNIKQEDNYWEISCKDEKIQGQRQCWLQTKRTFEVRHCYGGDFFNWIDAVIMNELAVKFNGMITDDGVENRWKGVPDKYPTFKSWMELMWSHVKSKKFVSYFIGIAKTEAPKEHRW